MRYPPYGPGSTAAFVVGDFNVDEPYFAQILQSSRLRKHKYTVYLVDKRLLLIIGVSMNVVHILAGILQCRTRKIPETISGAWETKILDKPVAESSIPNCTKDRQHLLFRALASK